MGNLFDAFISYGRADSKAFATKLYAHLLEQGLNIWFDQNDIPLGVDFQNQIDDGIEKAHNFLFLIAPHSINSPYCGKEIELARLSSTFGEKPVISDRILENTFLESLLCKDSKYDKLSLSP
jgi:hypothetical protein